MKKFVITKEFLDIFPDAKIGIIVCNGVNNQAENPRKYAKYLREAEEMAWDHIENPIFLENPVIKTWREAFYKFRTKKGARCSIEALLKRISKGDSIGCISPLVDIYNGVSLKYGVPIGGEDIDKISGDLLLTVANGSEDFITLGSEKSEPPYEGEVVYKDDEGAVCRCFNWRESVRTMLVPETTNAFMCLECVDPNGEDTLRAAVDELKALIESELGATCRSTILSAEAPSAEIVE